MARYPVELYVRLFDPEGRRFVDGNAVPPAETEGKPARAAVFIDRDGVINDDGDYVNTAEDFELYPGVADAIRRLNDNGWLVIVVTNQGGVALEYTTLEELDAIHSKMVRLLDRVGAHVDAIYAALAFPDGTIPELRLESPYRKPGAGMLYQAQDDLGIDLPRSFLVGDTTTDIAAGKNAGCTAILVRTGFAGSDRRAPARPDHVVADLSAAVDLILKR
jgi:histidinol-phosphate phosphatase family protein